MHLKIYMEDGDGFRSIAYAPLSKKNKKRVDILSKTQSGASVLTQILINHELGIMDANEAVEKLFSKLDSKE